MFAAIVNDGTQDVVIGVGATEELSRLDANFIITSMARLRPLNPLKIKRVVEITDDQAELYDKGVTGCSTLNIPDSV
jgi:hypothetical protein